MPFVSRKSLFTLGVLAVVAVIAIASFIWSGIYNVAADDHHTRPVYSLMETVRKRSIEARASKLEVPALKDPARITQGAGNYDAMCTGCHLKPGMTETELSKGLYPEPPDLTKYTVDAAEAFWVIKHGIKASGMPAWGKSMDDQYIWNMVAFLQELPKLNAAQYEALVASSGGHSHGGGETGGHPHGGSMEDEHGESAASDHPHAPGQADHHDPKPAAGMTAKPKAEGTTHVHADGKTHVHAPAAAKPTPKPAAPAASSPTPSTPPAPTTDTKPAEPEHDDHDHQH